MTSFSTFTEHAIQSMYGKQTDVFCRPGFRFFFRQPLELMHTVQILPQLKRIEPQAHEQCDSQPEVTSKEYSSAMYAKRTNNSKKHFTVRPKPVKSKAKKRFTYKPHGGPEVPFDEIPPLPAPQKASDLVNILQNVHSAIEHVPPDQRDEMTEWIGHLESIAIMCYHLKNSRNWSDIVVAVVGFAKMYVSSPSLLAELYKIIQVQEETNDPHSWDSTSIRDSWNLFKVHPMFTKITTLVAGVLSLSVCKMKEVTWSPMGFEVIKIKAAEKAMTGFDFIDSSINVFTWLWETGFVCMEHRSLTPLLYADQDMAKFNDECDYVLAYADTALAGNTSDLSDFTKKVSNCLERVISLKKARSSGPTAAWLQNRYSQLVAIEEKLVCKNKNTAIRFAPIGWLLTGPSGVGKSTLSKLTMKTSLHSMGFSTDSSRILTLDQDDKYQSTYTSDIEGIYIDDIGNTKSQFVQQAASSYVIKMFNNMAAQAVKAELNEKGRVFITFKVGVMSSNKDDGGFGEFTNCLESVLRRFYSVRVKVKPEYQIPSGASLNTRHPDLRDAPLTKDVWLIDIEECIVTEHIPGQYSPQMCIAKVEIPGKGLVPAKDLNLEDYLLAVVFLSKEHLRAQTNVVTRSRKFDDMPMCELCCLPDALCKCKLDPHSFEALSDLATQTVKKVAVDYVKSIFSPITYVNSLLGYMPVKYMATKALQAEVAEELNEHVTPFLIAITPSWLVGSRWGKRYISLWSSGVAYKSVRSQIKMLCCVNAATLTFGLFSHFTKQSDSFRPNAFYPFISTMGASVTFLPVLAHRYFERKAAVKEEYFSRRDALPQAAEALRKRTGTSCTLLLATAAVGIAMMKMWNQNRVANLELHGSRDDEPGWFGWVFGDRQFTVESDVKVKHSTTMQLVDKSARNLAHLSVTREDGSQTSCNAFFPRKSMVLIPLHVFYPNADIKVKPSRVIDCHFRRNGSAGSMFKCKVSINQVYKYPDLDLVAAYIPNCPDFATITHYLPLSRPTGVTCAKLLIRDKDLKEQQSTLSVKTGETEHSFRSFYGGTYLTPLARRGSCMGPVISDTSSPCIIGFHIAGDSSTDRGAMQTVLQADVEKGIAKLNGMYGIHLSAQAGEIPLTQYDIPLIVSKNIHPMCSLASATEETQVEIIGATRLRSTQKSSVEQSVMSPFVEEIMGVPNKWGPPKMSPNWKAFDKTLEHIVNPAETFDPDLVTMAMEDYMLPLRPLMKDWAKKEDFRPLTLKETVMGIDGKRFIDAIPMNTSTGFPLFQRKEKWFDETRDEKGVLLDRVPDPQIMTEMKRMTDLWRQGTRAYPVTSASLKDEPTPIDSEKVRAFQGGACAFGIMLRKYFLPMLRFLHNHPMESENSVGVNAFGPEWQDLMNHSEKFVDESDESIAWDHSKYDVRMSSQITRATMYMFIELAELGGYSEEDLTIMRTMVADLVHPLVDWNGVMYLAFNMNTTGNNLTVDINCGAGSIYIRVGFFNKYRDVPVGHFRRCVAASIYGDDLKGSVKKKYRGFNFIYFRDFLAKHGMKITLPSKDDSGTEFMRLSDVDFLKRKSNYIPEIGRKIGALDEDSIFKSLHSNVKSKNISVKELQTNVVQCAMHEWFAHGREKYDERLSQMKEICKKIDLPVNDLLVPFDVRVEHWKTKYSYG